MPASRFWRDVPAPSVLANTSVTFIVEGSMFCAERAACEKLTDGSSMSATIMLWFVQVPESGLA